ncbi:MAG: MogA/MoaB family molybdenum cofactor biosynthesis protein [Phycisphaeraceae bacterium]|nr:MAG: MogA/MoaB family molybdenum cofactor biosynthesis protein [Phycisphaeraceae bacterium]
MSKSTCEHRRQASEGESSRRVACAVLTVSDTRTPETDKGGDLVARLLEEAGHEVVERAIVPDESARIGAWIDERLANPGVRAILTTGGTGIAKRDTTIDVVRARLATELEGFGELFRMLSWEEVGAAAMLSRAVAGLATHDTGGDTFIFAMPGSVNAVETAMTKLIAPEIGHLVWERVR